MNHTCLCLPAEAGTHLPTLRDGRLSWPWTSGQMRYPSPSPPITHGSSSSSPSSLSPLSSSLTLSVFHSELKTWLVDKSFPPYRPFLYLPDWFHGLSEYLTFLFCSTAGLVCMVFSKPALSRFSKALEIYAISIQFNLPLVRLAYTQRYRSGLESVRKQIR